jgi:cation transporter-like permease
MQMPDATRIVRTAVAELAVLSLGATSAWVVYYLYGADLLTKMLLSFSIFDGLGFLGLILLPILLLIMMARHR